MSQPASIATVRSEKPPYGTHGKSIEEFLSDGHFIRVILGGRGSGKTRGLAEDITRHLWRSAGGKAIIARQTETSQEDSSIDTFWQFFETLGGLYSPTIGLFKSWNNGRTFRVPSALAVKRMQEECSTMTSRAEIANWIIRKGDALCGYIEFRGLPDADKGKFRGMECSYLALVEADQISKKQFDLSLACLRWKGTDPETCDDKGFIEDRSVTLDTNPPSPSHWIAELEEAEKKKPEHDRIMRFWHIETYENEHNLPENYIRDTILMPYANNPPMLDRMLYGKYADAYIGRPVMHAYRRECHEAEKLGWLRGATMVVGADVGTWNTSLISAFAQRGENIYWWALREIVLQDSDTDRQAVALLQVLAQEFPFWNQGNEICPETYFFCDPAAANSNFSTGPTSSSVKIFASHGLHFAARMPDRGLQTSIATVNRLLEQHHTEKTPQGLKTVWHFKIDTNRCPKLTSALRGAYRYPEKGEVGYGSDQPLKGTLCDGADHSMDGLRYAIVNALSLARERHSAGMTSREKPVTTVEPKRTI